ncbi:MAG: hypothetical protein NTW27_13175 [Deltaproteobacteria bacterium]|nr:hypothetical protein [Deltaproteobacteria bacterium]
MKLVKSNEEFPYVLKDMLEKVGPNYIKGSRTFYTVALWTIFPNVGGDSLTAGLDKRKKYTRKETIRQQTSTA